MRILSSVLSGVAVAALSALPLAWITGGLSVLHGTASFLALAAGGIASAVSWMITPPSSGRAPRTVWDWLMIGIFACASARAFLWLIYADGDVWKILSPNNLSDLTLHLSIIQWLAAAPSWWPASPILAGDPLRYPFGSDLFNALLLSAGVPLISGLLICALAGSALACGALWRWGGPIAIAALLFNGGFAGYELLRGGNPDGVAEWKNLFLTMFVTQRGYLYALPAGLVLLAAWREETFGKDRGAVLPLPVQALLLGVMPLFSVHATLFLGVIMATLFLIEPSARHRFAMLAALAAPSVLLIGWLVTTGTGGHLPQNAIGWKPGWMSGGKLLFWFWNFGISLPLVLFLAGFLLLRRDESLREARAFVLPSVLILTACMFIRFAPWEWDNMKLMIWAWLVIVPFVWSVLLSRLPVALRILALVLLFGSGAATLVAGLDGRHGYELVKRSALHNAEWLLRDIPRDRVIASAPEWDNPVLVLGHRVVAGYEGNLWSHGMDYRGRWNDLNSVMMGEEGWREKAKALGVDYIYWGELESRRWPESRLPWAHKEGGPTLHAIDAKE